jgi:hypothetical protein
MGNNSKHTSSKAQYQGYKIEGRWRKNKLAKLEARVLVNSNDDSALKTFEKGSKTYGRSKPGNKGWFPPQEQKLLREVGSEVETIRVRAKEKLARLIEIHNDPRPSAIRMKATQPTLAPIIADQFLAQGIISQKRHKSIKQTLGRVRHRRG